MRFSEALKAMKEGHKVKLPSWAGYWAYEAEVDRIWMHCKDGRVLEIRETDVLSYTLENICSDEWVIADETNTPELGGIATFSFGEAIKYLKRGFKVKRQGWNGKNQYVGATFLENQARYIESLGIVEVVLCKECMWARPKDHREPTETPRDFICQCAKHHYIPAPWHARMAVKADDFCSYGERRSKR